jgi:hypothetical protein
MKANTEQGLMPDEHLLVEATIRYSAKGHTGPPSKPKFFKASSLVQMMSLTEGYIVTLSGRRMWLN